MVDQVPYPEKLTLNLPLDEETESQQLRVKERMARGYPKLLIVNGHHMLIYMFLGGELLLVLKKIKLCIWHEHNKSENTPKQHIQQAPSTDLHKHIIEQAISRANIIWCLLF